MDNAYICTRLLIFSCGVFIVFMLTFSCEIMKCTQVNMVKLPNYKSYNKTVEKSGTFLDQQIQYRNQSTERIVDGLLESMPKKTGSKRFLLTLFTTWNTNPEKDNCRNNTIKNWSLFYPYVKTVFFTDDPNLSESLKKYGWDVLTPKKSSIGVPILKYMYLKVMKKYNSTFYAYVNGDILFTESLIKTLRFIVNANVNKSKPLLIVGQRTDAANVTEEQASTFDQIINASKSGKLHPVWGLDYFITNSIYPWKSCPEVVIGRIYYDNWLLLNARKHKFVTIDATKTILALHQLTMAGNYEGHKRPNAKYNDVILRKSFKNIYYGAGRISCASYNTNYESLNRMKIIKRTIPTDCFPL